MLQSEYKGFKKCKICFLEKHVDLDQPATFHMNDYLCYVNSKKNIPVNDSEAF